MSNDAWSFPEFPFPSIERTSSNDPNPTAGRLRHGESQRRANVQVTRTGGGGSSSPQEEETASEDIEDIEDIDPRNKRNYRKSRHKSEEENQLHDLIRIFLRDKGIIPEPAEPRKNKKGKTRSTQTPQTSEAPLAVDQIILEAYRLRDHPGPTKDYMPISWTSAISHPWNERVVQLLAAEFKRNVKACHYQQMTVLPNVTDSIATLIRRKISNRQATMRKTVRKRTQAAYLSRVEFDEVIAQETQAERLQRRRTERRKNLYVRRNETIAESIDARDKDTELWSEIQSFCDLFTEQDMSSDETETEAQFASAKTLRRVRKHWITEEVSLIFRFVDQSYSRRKPGGTLKRGNAPLLRIWESKSVNRTCSPTPGLPRNIYSHDLSPDALATLEPMEPVMLPRVP